MQLSESELSALATIAQTTGVAAHSQIRRRERDEAKNATIFALAELAERRDQETGQHLERVSRYCELIARAMRAAGCEPGVLDERFVEDIYRCAPMHDIGKVGIPDSILLKNDRLNGEEWRIMKTHTEIGAATLRAVIATHGSQSFLRMSMEIAWCHHEKWDGTGYPRGLSGREIPLAARILALADVYDALTSARPYKDPWPHARALDWIRERGGSHFDPDAVAAFLEHAEEADAIRARLADPVADGPTSPLPPELTGAC
jgi:putative two-component system response regulator